jgi:1-pyrroline-5-carboxylate dehydrogenase
MTKGFFNVPVPKNEPVKSYLPGSPERKELKAVLAELKTKS